MASSFTGTEWIAFIGCIILWLFPSVIGFSYIRRTMLTSQNGQLWNCFVAGYWMFCMLCMGLSTFFWWQQVTLQETADYQASMWLYLLAALFSIPVPGFIASRLYCLAHTAVIMVIGLSIAITTIDFVVISTTPAPYLATFFTLNAIALWFWMLVCACFGGGIDENWVRMVEEEEEEEGERRRPRRTNSKKKKSSSSSKTKKKKSSNDEEDGEEEEEVEEQELRGGRV